MRVAGLFALALLLPVTIQAANPLTLTTYTVSQDRIYPGVTIESGLATTTAIDVAFSESVKASIKLVSSNGVTARSLYSSSNVKNPDPKIWDGKDTAGTRVADGVYTVLITATSTADSSISIADSSRTITVASSEDAGVSSDTESADTAAPAGVAVSAGGGSPEYIPIPTLRIVTSDGRTVSSGADTAFTAAVYDNKGRKRDDVTITWSFGDGMKRVGASVFHAYYGAGEYMLIVHATTPDGGDVQKEIIITVKDAGIKIGSVSSRGITLVNTDSRTLDLSSWRLSSGGREFKIPEDTQILAGRTVLFPSQIIQLPYANTASLLYPSGEVAAVYPSSVIVSQPSPASVSYKQVQEVEPITSLRANVQPYDEAVRAPAVATKLAAAGAALPPVEESTPAADTKSLSRSPWLFGLLGVVALAGSAFIFL